MKKRLWPFKRIKKTCSTFFMKSKFNLKCFKTVYVPVTKKKLKQLLLLTFNFLFEIYKTFYKK